MEQVCEHEPSGANLSENHLNRVCQSLPRLRQRRVAEPLGERLAAPLGRRFDLFQFLGRKPGRYSLGAEDRLAPVVAST